MEELGEMTEGARGVSDTTRKPTESTNLGPRGLTETEPPTKDHARTGPRSPAHIEQMHSLVFVWIPHQPEQGSL